MKALEDKRDQLDIEKELGAEVIEEGGQTLESEDLGERLITKGGKELKFKIGLEIHIALISKYKSFSRTKAEEISFTSLGLLGTLPQLNTEAIRATYKLAFALNSELAKEVCFERKSYFYFDLPRGYQITQFLNPIGREGYIFLPKLRKKFRVRTIVLEEDTAASFSREKGYTLSCERLGLPLIEIVTEPDFLSSKEAIECIKWIRFLLIALKLSKVEFESGQIRVDLNVSLADEEGKECTGRAEIKNLASYKAIVAATKSVSEYFIEKIERKEEDLFDNFTFGWIEKESQLVLSREKKSGTQYLFTAESALPVIKLSALEREELCNVDQKEIYQIYEGIKKSRLAEREQIELISNYDLFWECHVLFGILKDWANSFFILKIFYSVGGNSSTIDNLHTFLTGLVERLPEGKKIKEYKFSNWKIREAFKKLSLPGAWVEVILDYYLSLPTISKEDILTLCEEVIEQESEELFKFIKREEKLFSFLMGIIKSKFEEKVDMSEAKEIVLGGMSNLVQRLKSIKESRDSVVEGKKVEEKEKRESDEREGKEELDEEVKKEDEQEDEILKTE